MMRAPTNRTPAALLSPFPKRIPLSVPHMSGQELGFVEEAFRANWVSTIGPHIDALEREFSALTGTPSVALASGTSALHLAVRLLGLRDGDEVVTPTLTFTAS